MPPLGFHELVAHSRRNDGYLGSRVRECERLPRAHQAAADDDRLDTLAVERDSEITHRNWPRLSDASRKTTYNNTTLPKVTADIRAARLACQPRNTRPSTRALTASQAARPQMSCGSTSARYSSE